MLKVFVVSFGMNNSRGVMIDWIENSTLLKKTRDKHKADLFLFPGGADIDPKLYAEKQHPMTFYSKERDEFEVRYWKYAMANNIPMVGICRGAQFLCAMSGGYIIQHTDGHDTGHHHPIKFKSLADNSVRSSFVLSTHHQMMYPYIMKEKDYELYAWSQGLSSVYEGAQPDVCLKDNFHSIAFEERDNSNISEQVQRFMSRFLNKGNNLVFKEPEIVHFKNTKSLAIQGHPERMNNAVFRIYCSDLVYKLLINKTKK